MIYVVFRAELSQEQHLPDGGLVIDLRARIFLPEDPTHWTTEVLTAACARHL